MKIYDKNPIGPSTSQTGRSQEAQQASRTDSSRSASSAGADKSSDHIEFSGTLSRLSRTLGAYGSSRAGRVQELAAQYQAGKYVADPSATSRGMVSELLSAGMQ